MYLIMSYEIRCSYLGMSDVQACFRKTYLLIAHMLGLCNDFLLFRPTHARHDTQSEPGYEGIRKFGKKSCARFLNIFFHEIFEHKFYRKTKCLILSVKLET